jgi:hypothetical protein
MEILISGKRTLFFLIFVGSNPQVQLEKSTFQPRNRPTIATSQKPEQSSLPVAVHFVSRQKVHPLKFEVLLFSSFLGI